MCCASHTTAAISGQAATTVSTATPTQPVPRRLFNHSVHVVAQSTHPHSDKKSIMDMTPPAFSNNIEKYQIINSLRKAPASAQIKLVIDLLLKLREALTPEQIYEACYVDVCANKAVFETLKNNHPKVSYDGRRFSYKSKYEVKNKNQLLDLIQNNPNGIRVGDLMDSYPKVNEDLQILRADNDVWLLAAQENMVYPNDTRCSIKVDDELKQLFHSVKLPHDFLDLENELKKSGIKPLTNTTKRKAKTQIQSSFSYSKTEKKMKKQQISKRTKLTNSHLPELFSTGY